VGSDGFHSGQWPIVQTNISERTVSLEITIKVLFFPTAHPLQEICDCASGVFLVLLV